MPGVHKATELATSLLHIGGLSGAAAHIAHDDTSVAISIALIASLCVLILTGAIVLAEVARVKMRQYVRKHELPASKPNPRDKEDPTP